MPKLLVTYSMGGILVHLVLYKSMGWDHIVDMYILRAFNIHVQTKLSTLDTNSTLAPIVSRSKQKTK